MNIIFKRLQIKNNKVQVLYIYTTKKNNIQKKMSY